MSSDKVTVDEPLISTDVDKLIRTVAERKRIALNELQQSCHIDKKNMDKWTRVLEDEGYITIEYGIRGTYVIWSGRGQSTEQPRLEQQARRTSGVSVASSASVPISRNIQVPEENEPEELLSRYLEKKKTSNQPDPDSLKTSILSSIKEEKEQDAKTVEDTGRNISDDVAEAFARSNAKESRRRANEASSVSLTRIPSDIYQEAGSATDSSSAATYSDSSSPSTSGTNPEGGETVKAKNEQPEHKEEAKSVFGSRNIAIDLPSRQKQVVSTENRDMLNAYMEEIGREKDEIAELKKEKEALYREKLMPIESKMETDLVAFTERIMDKHAKITQLQEKILEFPQKVEELEQAHAEVSRAMEEGKGTLARTSKKLADVMEELKFSKGEVEEKIADIKSMIDDENTKLGEIDNIRAAADERLDKLDAAVSLVRSQMEELHGTMDMLSGDIADASKTKNELSEMVLSVKGTISNNNEELQSLESELEELSKVEGWFSEYIHDYEKKVAEIEQYVVRNDEELVELQESAESVYMKKYLSELESITESYQKELDGALSEEKDIESRISSSKEKVGQLISESRDMIRNMREGTPVVKDFDTLRRSVSEKAGSINAKIQEKSRERARLREDSAKARRTRGIKGKSAPKSAVRSAVKSAVKSVTRSAASKRSAKKGRKR